jgi:hypothetical protein
MRIFLTSLLLVFGLVMGSFGFIRLTWSDFALMLVLGLGNGYIAILYDLLATTPVLLTVGMLTAARFGSVGTVSLAASFQRVLKLPRFGASSLASR